MSNNTNPQPHNPLIELRPGVWIRQDLHREPADLDARQLLDLYESAEWEVMEAMAAFYDESE